MYRFVQLPDNGEDHFLALGRGRVDTVRSKFHHVMSAASEGEYNYMATVPNNRDHKTFVISKQLMQDMDPEMNSFDKLMYLNHELFLMIENSVPMDLLAQMYSSQLITYGDRHLLNQSRTYYRVLRRIVIEGQNRGQLRTDVSVNEIIKAYAMLERAMIYDWCICNGDYSLYQYSGTELPLFLRAYKAQ